MDEDLLESDMEIDDVNADPNYTTTDANDSPSQAKIPKTTKPVKQKSYKQKVERKWTDAEILNLIKEMQTRPVLWDMSRPAYKLPKDST